MVKIHKYDKKDNGLNFQGMVAFYGKAIKKLKEGRDKNVEKQQQSQLQNQQPIN